MESFCTAPEAYRERVVELVKFLEEASHEKDGENDWVFIKNNQDVHISYKPVANTVHTLRGIATFPAKPESLIELCKGLDHWDSLDPFFKTGESIEKIDVNNEILIALYSAGVPLVFDREFLVFETRGKKGESFFIASFSIDRADIPNPKYPDAVRGEIIKGGFWIEPQGDLCKVTWIVAMDPKGWIPVAVVNLICGDEPLVLAAVREAVGKLEK